mmetsp:Transcript_65827/g.109392  ORF Transcript_65827/g.109392 Transcript_65827/m.109392 type:complete len:143 (-) Transcript_65827:201-629(-)
MPDDDFFLAYINGKSAGRVGNVVTCGSHRFSGEEWDVPLESACVLHFESCPYSRWRDKFMHYAKLTSRLSSIPFPFYLDSIKFCREHAGEQHEAKLRTFWRRRKQFFYSGHADKLLVIRHLGLKDAPPLRVTTRSLATGKQT